LPLRCSVGALSALFIGVPRTVTMTSEYVELSQEPIDVSVVRVPADYRLLDMRKMASRIRRRCAIQWPLRNRRRWSI
jgi:hypothetical protein